MSKHAPERGAGFALVEMLVASAVLASALVVLFQLASTGQRLTRVQPDAADMRQRLRVAADTIQRDLLMAGAGLAHGSDAGPLVNYLPAVLPMRTGARNPDPELSFFDDRVSIIYAEAGATAVRLMGDMPAPAADVPVDASAAGCPAAGLCGFHEGTRALIVDTSGSGPGFDLFSVSGVAAGLAHGPPDPEFSRAYPAASTRVVPIRQRVYHFEAASRRLMLYDGHQTDVPVAENIVLVRFQYFVTPSSRGVPMPATGSGNCVFAATSPPTPLLSNLGGVLLSRASGPLLTDGPLCGLPPRRFDGDLLRIRRVRVTIRAQVADRALRGSGADFVVPGLASDAAGYVPDIEVTFDVTPRNLRPTR